MRYAIFPALAASQGFAHPGNHVHSSDGGSWLTVSLALAGIAIVGGIALLRARK